jgi:hypothetical protein
MKINTYFDIKSHWYWFVAMIFATTTLTGASAQLPEREAASQMIAEGGWVLAKVDARVNILEYPTRAGALELNSTLDVRARTIEFDCNGKNYAHVGWRVSGKFIKNNNLQTRKIQDKTIMSEYSKFVCPYWSNKLELIDILLFESGNKLSLVGREIFIDNNNKMAWGAFIMSPGKTSKASWDCLKYYPKFTGPPKNASVEEVKTRLADWACRNLNPNVARIEEVYPDPLPPRPTAVPPAPMMSVSTVPTSDEKDIKSENSRKIISAKSKCKSLGYTPATPKFGKCVLTLSR